MATYNNYVFASNVFKVQWSDNTMGVSWDLSKEMPNSAATYTWKPLTTYATSAGMGQVVGLAEDHEDNCEVAKKLKDAKQA